jgi:hypothetical protein
VVKHGRARQATDDNMTRHMRFACWMTKATNTHSEYVELIAFPRYRWLCERVSVLRYTYISCVITSAHPLEGWQWSDCGPRADLSLSQSVQLHGSPHHLVRPRKCWLYFVFCIEDIFCVKFCSALSTRSARYYEWVGSPYSFLHWVQKCFNLLKPSGNFTYRQV